MVSVEEKQISGKKYFYLVYTARKGDKITKKEKYLGAKLPENINELKRDFVIELTRAKWYPIFEKIKNQSKAVKLMPKIVRGKNLEDFVVRFTYNTQRIEGSTLTLRETADLLLEGTTPNVKPLRDVKEAEAHKKIFLEMFNYNGDLSLKKVLEWHKELFKETNIDMAGKIREYGVAIRGSRFTPPNPTIVKRLLEEFFKWYHSSKDKLNPVELAGLVHLKFVTIHPFADGNGRISRLMMNFVLKKKNYPLVDIKYENRRAYYNALEKSQVKKDDITFLRWFFKNYIKIGPQREF